MMSILHFGEEMKRGIFSVGLCFLGGLGLGVLGIAATLGNPFDLYASERTEQLYVMDHFGRQSCAAAFGSSHIHNGFDPREFDRVLAANNMPTNSLNMAISGGSQGEQYLMAKRYLASRPASPIPDCRPLVLLEINAGVNFQSAHITHPRTINAYSMEVVSLLQDFVSPDLPMLRYVGRAAFAYFETLMHYANVGMLASHWLPHAYDQHLIEEQTGSDRRGLLLVPNTERDSTAVADVFRAEPVPPKSEPAQITRGAATLVADLVKQPRGDAFEYIYVVAPMLSDLTTSTTYPDCVVAAGRQIKVINVALPSQYPELYQAELWHDPGHLNGPGAIAYTHLIANAIARQQRSNSTASTVCAKV